MILYAAYGSNINIEHMEILCPEAKLYDVGFIENHILEFRGSRNNAHATIRAQNDNKVPVIVWAVNQRCVQALEHFESFPQYYHKEYHKIHALNGIYENVLTFVMNDDYKKYGTPDSAYYELIAQGYKEHSFDYDYLNERLAESRRRSDCS